MASVKRICKENYYWYINDLTSRVVAESGRPSDRMHLGKILLRSLRDAPSDFIHQIDAGAGRKINIGEILQRSINCATSLRNLGLGVADCIVIMAPNHIDICAPLYAGLYLGVKVACLNRKLGVDELRHYFKCCQPKVIFCQSEKTSDIEDALKLENIEAKILAFDEQSYTHFIESGDTNINHFKATEFDPEKTIAVVLPTSGTTGAPKLAALGHDMMTTKFSYVLSMYEDFPTPTRLFLIVSHLSWVAAVFSYILSGVTRLTTLTSSAEMTISHMLDIISEHKPTYGIISSPLAMTLVRSADEEKKSNLRHFEAIVTGGSPVKAQLVKEFKEVAPNTQIINIYGMTEIGVATMINYDATDGEHFHQAGSGKIKLVDASSGNEVTEPNKTGELWVKGPYNFKEYLNNPVATKETYSADGWLKTGDLFYRDEKHNYYFVDRLKLMLKHVRVDEGIGLVTVQVSPVELEAVIRQHPCVMDAAVTGIPDLQRGDLVVAIVVRKEGAAVTAQEIKDLVRESLPESKQLYGGVYFVDNLPLTISSKVDRMKLKEMAITFDKASEGTERI